MTGSYTAAFVNGLVWNLVNLAVVLLLMRRLRDAAGGAGGPGAPSVKGDLGVRDGLAPLAAVKVQSDPAGA